MDNGYDIDNDGFRCAEDHPVPYVTWYDVVKWCNALSEREGLTPVYAYSGQTYRNGEPTHTSISQNLSANGFRLPLEAEWEFAARGGNQSMGYTYSGSNNIGEVGWYASNSYGAECDFQNTRGTWPVAQKNANELSLYDMSGNVWEWCWDTNGTGRYLRGGDWNDNASGCAISNRRNQAPDYVSADFGFRLARTPL